MPQKILGIDIGSYSVKIAEIERSFRTFEFVGFYERRIQYNELLTPEESAGISLQGLIDDHQLTWESAVCGFPGQRVSARLITFPFGNAKKIEQTVRFEIEGQIPFHAAELVVDHAIVWSTKEASRVLACYVKTSDMVKLLTMLQNVGVDPRAVCVEGVELINLVNLGMVPPEAPYAIIDIGHEKTTVSICHGKRIGYVRAISVAGKTITEAIAKNLDLPFEEAERLKIEMGNVPMDEGEEMDEITKGVVSAILHVLDELMLHLRQTFFTYRDAEDLSVEGIYLSGGTSRLPGLDRYLSDRLKQNVAYINCTDFHFSKLERADAHRHVISQALSLALEGVAPGGLAKINLRQGEFAFKGNVEQLGGNMKYMAGAILLIIGLALTYFTTNYYSLKGKLEAVEGNVFELVRQAVPDVPARSVRTPKAALAAIKSKEDELRERQKQLAVLVGNSPLDVLREISISVPMRGDVVLDVDKLNITAERVVMSGSTDSFEAVDRLRQSLEKSKFFRSVTSGNVRKGVKDEVKFDFSIEIQKEAEEETS